MTRVYLTRGVGYYAYYVYTTLKEPYLIFENMHGWRVDKSIRVHCYDKIGEIFGSIAEGEYIVLKEEKLDD